MLSAGCPEDVSSSHLFYIATGRKMNSKRVSFASFRDANADGFNSGGSDCLLRSQVVLMKTFTTVILGIFLNGTNIYRFSSPDMSKTFEILAISR